jgi:hypothetical protein
VKNCNVIFDTAGHRRLKMQLTDQWGPKNYFQDPSGLLIAKPTHQGRLDTGCGESNYITILGGESLNSVSTYSKF